MMSASLGLAPSSADLQAPPKRPSERRSSTRPRSAASLALETVSPERWSNEESPPSLRHRSPSKEAALEATRTCSHRAMSAPRRAPCGLGSKPEAAEVPSEDSQAGPVAPALAATGKMGAAWFVGLVAPALGSCPQSARARRNMCAVDHCAKPSAAAASWSNTGAAPEAAAAAAAAARPVMPTHSCISAASFGYSPSSRRPPVVVDEEEDCTQRGSRSRGADSRGPCVGSATAAQR
mmetsp:Transcript_9422/g.21357  ORF Transcript_9422/g.21357 Transcript_9422/m.21357 type:complete len:236 (+) Transcript_9422:536-1243(+)